MESSCCEINPFIQTFKTSKYFLIRSSFLCTHDVSNTFSVPKTVNFLEGSRMIKTTSLLTTIPIHVIRVSIIIIVSIVHLQTEKTQNIVLHRALKSQLKRPGRDCSKDRNNNVLSQSLFQPHLVMLSYTMTVVTPGTQTVS